MAGHLRDDLEAVTGTSPGLEIVDGARPGVDETVVVVIGTVGRSALIDGLIESGGFDASGLGGVRETFIVEAIDDPWPGVERALVIAGSDKRGTIYGMFGLSRQIGVSPWAWWADVPVERRTELHVLPGRHTDGTPKVRYRGIFINDEWPAFAEWAGEKYGGVNSLVYERVFELILRNRGNFLWPAMWGRSLWDDDARSAELADEYGIVLSTSHHEPLMRAHVEWARYGEGDWNYDTNERRLRAFWREGMERAVDREVVVTLAMRGDGDEAMSEETNVDLLERIVRDQREIIEEVTGEPAEETPQVWALYKEVQDYYDNGMRVPDDVTLLLCDDNWGNIRKLPEPGEAERAGGYGVYYHFDYVGSPRNYKWVNTNPLPRTWEQMRLAWEHGVDRIWVVNVGDIKPMELPISFFLDMAWDPEAVGLDELSSYTARWSAEQFPAEHAAEIASITDAYLKINGRRKPELLSPETYSLHHYREYERVVGDYNALVERAEAVARALPDEYMDAYQQLVLYPVRACANVQELYYTVALNHLYAEQGRAATNELAEKARAMFAYDAELAREQNDEVADGKWARFADQPNIGYDNWQQPERDRMPEVREIQVSQAGSLGVAIEGDERWWPAAPVRAVLNGFSAFDPGATRYVELFNRGRRPLEYTIEASAPWVRVMRDGRGVRTGELHTQHRIEIGIDWAALPEGAHRAPVSVRGSDGTSVTVFVEAAKPEVVSRGSEPAFIETNGVVSIEAAHFDRSVPAGGAEWKVVGDLGRTGSAVTTFPMAARSSGSISDRAYLEYRVHVLTPGEVTLHVHASPTLDYHAEGGRRYAVAIGDEEPRVVALHGRQPDWGWQRIVANNISVGRTTHRVDEPGVYTVRLYRVDSGVVVQKLVIDAGGLRESYLGPPESPRTTATGVRMPTRIEETAQVAEDTGGFARFDWFEYTGRDAVYERDPAGRNEYTNPVLAGYYPDPSITRVGDTFYLVNSSFTHFPGIPIHRSKDLVNWEPIGHVIERPEQMNFDGLGLSRGIFAPAIEHHDGVFYLVSTCVDCGGNFVMTATDPAGDWSDPAWLPEVRGIDPSLFFDDDGKAYIINNDAPIGEPRYDGHRALWTQAFDPETLTTFGPRKMVVDGGADPSTDPIWIEGPHIYKVDGRYYLICAEGGTSTWHSQVVFRSDSPCGPWEPWEGNPILTQRHLDPDRPDPITSAGHADFVRLDDGSWWSVFLAVRPYEGNYYNTGRETFLMPVEWRGGWPVITRGDETIPYTHRRPRLSGDGASGPPLSGNFTVRDEFDAIGPEWLMLRTPREQWHDVTSEAGVLTLRARPVGIGDRGQPSYLGRRLQHMTATATLAMRYRPSREGDRAGLVAMQSDEFYLFFGLVREGGETWLRVDRRAGPGDPSEGVTLAETMVEAGDSLTLRIEIDGGEASFAYSTGGRFRELLSGADATVLSTQRAGGFVGATVGPYAYRGGAR